MEKTIRFNIHIAFEKEGYRATFDQIENFVKKELILDTRIYKKSVKLKLAKRRVILAPVPKQLHAQLSNFLKENNYPFK